MAGRVRKMPRKGERDEHKQLRELIAQWRRHEKRERSRTPVKMEQDRVGVYAQMERRKEWRIHDVEKYKQC